MSADSKSKATPCTTMHWNTWCICRVQCNIAPGITMIQLTNPNDNSINFAVIQNKFNRQQAKVHREVEIMKSGTAIFEKNQQKSPCQCWTSQSKNTKKSTWNIRIWQSQIKAVLITIFKAVSIKQSSIYTNELVKEKSRASKHNRTGEDKFKSIYTNAKIGNQIL